MEKITEELTDIRACNISSGSIWGTGFIYSGEICMSDKSPYIREAFVRSCLGSENGEYVPGRIRGYSLNKGQFEDSCLDY